MRVSHLIENAWLNFSILGSLYAAAGANALEGDQRKRPVKPQFVDSLRAVVRSGMIWQYAPGVPLAWLRPPSLLNFSRKKLI